MDQYVFHYVTVSGVFTVPITVQISTMVCAFFGFFKKCTNQTPFIIAYHIVYLPALSLMVSFCWYWNFHSQGFILKRNKYQITLLIFLYFPSTLIKLCLLLQQWGAVTLKATGSRWLTRLREVGLAIFLLCWTSSHKSPNQHMEKEKRRRNYEVERQLR